MMPARLHVPAKDSAAAAVNDADACFDFDGLAAYLNLSRRTLSRLVAGGLLPPADLTLTGRNQRRWLRSSITRWLASKPKLPGRGKGGRP
jgi:hypothetical protein